MKITSLVIIACMTFSSNLCAQPAQWNWYYAAFNAPTPNSGLLLRQGTAQVDLTSTSLNIEFSEQKLPEARASLKGKVLKGRIIDAKLKRFFPSGDDYVEGVYNSQGNRKTCLWQEILLRPKVPDGTVLVLARTDGPCQ